MNVAISGRTTPLAVRIYRLLLRVLPPAMRDRHGADAVDVFGDMYRAARKRGPVAGWLLLAWSTGQLAFCAAGEHWDERRGRGRMTTAPGGEPPYRRSGSREVFSTLLRDLRFAGRTLARKPAFAISTILIVAVGIGATTTIFSVVDTVVLRSLPYPESERLVLFSEGAHNFPDVNEWIVRLGAFSALAVTWDERFGITGDGEPEQVDGARVNAEFFEMFGATPHLGRFFVAGEFIGEPTAVVLGHGIWQRRWGGQPDVVGDTITIDGRPLLVAGVVGPEFRPPEIMVGDRIEVYLPLDLNDPAVFDSRGLHVLSVAGRLRDEVPVPVAQEQIDAFLRERADEFPNRYLRDGELRNVPLVPLRQATVRRVTSTLYLLLAAVGFMLLIACANVANLFLARGTERGREIALCAALGASRGRIIGQVLTESVAVGVVGGVAGIALAYLGVNLFADLNPGNIPRLQDIAVDLRILGFAFLTSVGTGVLFGLLPAAQAARTGVNELLKDGAASVTAGRRGRRTRGALVVAEIALALVLLAGAGLLVRSLIAMVRVDPGFETEQLVDLSLQLGPVYTEEERVAFVRDLLERLDATPGTQAAAAGWSLPFVYHGNTRCCWRTSIRDQMAPVPDEEILTIAHPVTPGYFKMLGAPLVRGRDLTEADNNAQPSVVILNQITAREVFGTEDVVGRSIVLGDESLTVVGVVGGVQHYGLSQDIENAVYVPFARFGGFLGDLHVGVRSQAQLESVVAGMREAVWALRPNQPIEEIVTMRQRVSMSLATPRFLSVLLGVFAAVALLLACGGIYGSMLYSVGQRQREMGIRLALGAAGGSVIRLVLGQGLVLTGMGLSLGVGGAMALSRVMRSLVWGIEPTDPTTFVVVTTILGVSALVACLSPAYRASRADPLQTLRAE